MSKALAMAIAAVALGSNVYAMGPDPGGHTGQGVTSESTRTDHPQGDKPVQQNGIQEPRPEDRAQAGANGTQSNSSSGQSGASQTQKPQR